MVTMRDPRSLGLPDKRAHYSLDLWWPSGEGRPRSWYSEAYDASLAYEEAFAVYQSELAHYETLVEAWELGDMVGPAPIEPTAPDTTSLKFQTQSQAIVRLVEEILPNKTRFTRYFNLDAPGAGRNGKDAVVYYVGDDSLLGGPQVIRYSHSGGYP